MKKSFLIYSLLFLLFVGCATYLTNTYINDAYKLKALKTEIAYNAALTKIEKPEGVICTDGSCYLPNSKEIRNDITFILGEDKGTNNLYYSAAEQYFRNNPEFETEWLITHCRTFVEVSNYLNKHAQKSAWGNINLVVHSNEWMGLGMSVVKDGPRVTVSALDIALSSGQIKPLNNNKIDAKTQINIFGCALGKNETLMKKIGEALGGNDIESPTVNSSKYFISYTTKQDKTEQYLTAYWQTYYKTGYRPGDIRLANSLQKDNPLAEVDFRDALSRKQPRFTGDSYHYSFNVPLEWIVTFPSKSERPLLDDKNDQMNFLNSQSELLSTIEALNIPIEKFRWQFRTIDYTFEDGVTEPAIMIKGKSTVLCILKALTKENSEEPIAPKYNDQKYFTTISPNTNKLTAH